ncbi:L-threonine dehydratase catabolic TdcB-like isoform X1 [Acropora millepora]|uniref:L-threonine dehydratase catabolic TdcB-like isoform X1 n=1 Tax=Acropora millepora TaxID=45264 RepID=UPI001CF253A4|nr:L-threonine dehydratase catabolic TdcB-like isoform X1 [Acropora millepora]
MAEIINLKHIESAVTTIEQSAMVRRTPLLKNVGKIFGFADKFKLHLKMENMQNTGSFKVRGIVNQVAHIPSEVLKNKTSLVSMSAGNYGKAFAFASKELNLPATLCMPDSAPINRANLIENLGVKVERMPKEEIIPALEQHVAEEGMYPLHPFDDLHLIAGMASVAIEILDEIPQPDVVVVCCGGGGLVSGVAAGLKLKGCESTRIYGVQPEAAPSMYLSKQQGHVVGVKSTNTIASGLAPPRAGEKTLRHVQEFVEDIILVSEDELKSAVKTFFNTGLVVEPAGAAAFAALQSSKIPDLSPESCVVAIVTGGNITPEELMDIYS